MPDAEKIIAEALVTDAHADDGWLSDAQTARLSVNTEGSVSFCGEGSIDVAHVASIAVAALREAGMLTETEWEYGSEGAEGTSDPDPRPLVDDKPYWPESIPDGVHEPDSKQAASIIAKWNEGDPGSCKLIRRRKAGPWEPVEGDPR